MSRKTLAGRTVLITGAARGMGVELARACVARGAQVALLGLEPDRLAAAVAELGPDRAAAFEVDVTDGARLDEAVDAAATHFGGLDVAVANAGITAFGPVETLDPATFERVIAVNLTGVWRTLRAALPHVRARRGYLLTVASMAAAMQSPLQAHYTASKAGAAAMTESLRLEMRGTGTRVGTAYLTFVATDMMKQTVSDPAGKLLWGGNTGGLNGMITLAEAVRGPVRGVERRAERIVVPKRLLPVVLAPGLFQAVFGRQFSARVVQAATDAARTTA